MPEVDSGSVVVFGSWAGAGAQFAVQAEQTGAVAVDQLELTDDFADGVFFFKLFVDEPVEDGTSVDVAGGFCCAVELADGFRDLLFVVECGLEDCQS